MTISNSEACIIRYSKRTRARPHFTGENQKKCKGFPREREWKSKQDAPTPPYVEHKAFFAYFLSRKKVGQANKSARGMPWHQEPTKDVTSCDKPREGANDR